MKWINVKDKLPKDYKDVLILMNNDLMDVSYGYKDINGEFNWVSRGSVTHWMRLPYRPTKDKQ